MALIGLRMMPTFPSPPLKFRTVGFPQYGYKASMSVGAFQRSGEVKSAPDIRSTPRCLSPAFARIRAANASWALSPTRATPPRAAVQAALAAYPRGPWLRSEFCCLAPSWLTTTPSVSLAGTRRFRGTAVYTSRLRCAGAPRRPARPSLLSPSVLSRRAIDPTPVGSRGCPVARAPRDTRLPRLVTESPPTRATSASYVRWFLDFGAALFASCYGPSVCLALLTGYERVGSRVSHPPY